MAKEIITRLIDDLDGSEAAETVQFGLDGKAYTIDLSKRNAAALRKALKRYIDAGVQVRGARKPAQRVSSPRGRASAKPVSDVRAWARKNGFQVSDRGRISAEVQRAFDAAH